MRKKRFNESQIIGVLKEYESGLSASELSRKYGIAESTLYSWRSRYGGMELAELKRLKQLEKEHRRLKQMYATLSMDHELLREVLEGKFGVGLSDEN